MKNIQFPNLLIISVNAWSNGNSTGNTISNHFGGWEKSKVSNIFLRDEVIDNDSCTSYFRICEKDILKSFFSTKTQGLEIEIDKKEANSSTILLQKRNKLKEFLVRLRPMLLLLFRELFWFVGFLKKKGMDAFLEKHNPELIHIHTPSLIYAHRILHYCHKRTKAKVILFFGDEIYSHKEFWPFAFLYQIILRYWIRKTIQISSKNYAATPELCDYYSQLFKVKFEVLYKGTSIETPKLKPHTTPYKITYAGNLLYGRWKTLAMLVQAIEQLSSDSDLFQLEVYTSTPISEEMNRKLNTKHARLFEARPFSEIQGIMKNSDIVLHVESFEEKFMKVTRYSFSTKIVDCIQSGSCTMGIGPESLASIGFLKKSDAAIVATSYETILEGLQKIVLNPDIMDAYSQKMHHFSKSIFDLTQIRERLYDEVIETLSISKFIHK